MNIILLEVLLQIWWWLWIAIARTVMYFFISSWDCWRFNIWKKTKWKQWWEDNTFSKLCIRILNLITSYSMSISISAPVVSNSIYATLICPIVDLLIYRRNMWFNSIGETVRREGERRQGHNMLCIDYSMTALSFIMISRHEKC